MIRFILAAAVVGGLLQQVFGHGLRPRKRPATRARTGKPARRPARRAAA